MRERKRERDRETEKQTDRQTDEYIESDQRLSSDTSDAHSRQIMTFVISLCRFRERERKRGKR